MAVTPLGPVDPIAILSSLPPGSPRFFLDCPPDSPGEGWGFSVLGWDPTAQYRSPGNDGQGAGDPLRPFQKFLDTHRPAEWDAPPWLKFSGGCIGYLSYDLKNRMDDFSPRQGYCPVYPEIAFMRVDSFIYINSDGLGWAVSRDKAGCARLQDTAAQAKRTGHRPAGYSMGSPRSIDPGAYRSKVRCIKDYIAAGDVYQVNLTYPMSFSFHGDPVALYRDLRGCAGAPMGAYLDFGDTAILSASPERFFRVEGRTIETRPIKGTRPRGRTPQEDTALKHALRHSAKDRAENLMIVDLMRNDLGRVCEYGSISVPSLCDIRSYETVHHMVSRVSGFLRDGVGPGDVFRALFPGGSVTGAPKIRAVEIIDELEDGPRGVYTGAMGYIRSRGEMDMAMAIRTLVIRNGEGHYHVGGGIVADSDPDEEYQETLNKAAVLMNALDINNARLSQRKIFA